MFESSKTLPPASGEAECLGFGWLNLFNTRAKDIVVAKDDKTTKPDTTRRYRDPN
jgi:hypothetical protein